MDSFQVLSSDSDPDGDVARHQSVSVPISVPDALPDSTISSSSPLNIQNFQPLLRAYINACATAEAEPLPLIVAALQAPRWISSNQSCMIHSKSFEQQISSSINGSSVNQQKYMQSDQHKLRDTCTGSCFYGWILDMSCENDHLTSELSRSVNGLLQSSQPHIDQILSAADVDPEMRNYLTELESDILTQLLRGPNASPLNSSTNSDSHSSFYSSSASSYSLSSSVFSSNSPTSSSSSPLSYASTSTTRFMGDDQTHLSTSHPVLVSTQQNTNHDEILPDLSDSPSSTDSSHSWHRSSQNHTTETNSSFSSSPSSSSTDDITDDEQEMSDDNSTPLSLRLATVALRPTPDSRRFRRSYLHSTAIPTNTPQPQSQPQQQQRQQPPQQSSPLSKPKPVDAFHANILANVLQAASPHWLHNVKQIRFAGSSFSEKHAFLIALAWAEKVPSHYKVSIDFSSCPNISQWDFAHFSQVEKEDIITRCNKLHSGIYSLILDGCPIKRLPFNAENNIFLLLRTKSISLKRTKIRNLWTVADALQPVALSHLALQDILLVPQDPIHPKQTITPETLLWRQLKEVRMSVSSLFRMQLSKYQTPVCSDENYRSFLITRLKSLKILDNVDITPEERNSAMQIVAKHFESVVRPSCHATIFNSIRSREIGTIQLPTRKTKVVVKKSHDESPVDKSAASSDASSSKHSHHAYRVVHHKRHVDSVLRSAPGYPECSVICNYRERPRQFEFHPDLPNVLVYGTLNGDVVVMNHRTSQIMGTTNFHFTCNATEPFRSQAVLGLCWLHNDKSKFVAGTDKGKVQLFDFTRMSGSTTKPIYSYEDFKELTSLSINSNDDFFVTSGYTNNIALYDLKTGVKLRTVQDCHLQHINVAKFANHNPNMIATSSFDRFVKLWDLREPCHDNKMKPIYSRQSNGGNVMVCFAPSDEHILVSAVDNEVTQYHTCDGRLERRFDIKRLKSHHNYTRSYYMNDADYIVTGSCEESFVRIFSARSGRQVREIDLDGYQAVFQEANANNFFSRDASPFVQSLRGDPWNPNSFATLVAYNNCPGPNSIVHFDLLKRKEYTLVPNRPDISNGC